MLPIAPLPATAPPTVAARAAVANVVDRRIHPVRCANRNNADESETATRAVRPIRSDASMGSSKAVQHSALM